MKKDLHKDKFQAKIPKEKTQANPKERFQAIPFQALPKEQFQAIPTEQSQTNSKKKLQTIPIEQVKTNSEVLVTVPKEKLVPAVPEKMPTTVKKEEFLAVPLDFLNKYQEKNENKRFWQTNDRIRFKLYELSQFGPQLSELRTGTITKVCDDSNFLETKVKNYGEILEIGERNLIDLEVEISEMAEERKIELMKYVENSKNSSNLNENLQKSLANNNKKEYSKEDFIARQVNFYFSDKNYAKDDFIQAHVKKHEEKRNFLECFDYYKFFLQFSPLDYC